MGEIAKSQDYLSFRATIPQKRLAVDDDCSKEWTIYDAGPRSVKCPIICLPPASGTADVFYRQILSLTAIGYRVIAVDYPVYWSLREFCEGFRRLVEHLQLDKIHIFGASLGGFLGQKFSESTWKTGRVASLILCNTFSDTTIFQNANSAPTFWMMPAIVLKKMVMGNFDKTMRDADISDSVDFMANRLDGLSQSELASRLKLNCMNSYIEPQKLRNSNITIMDVFDESALSDEVKEDMYKCYPDAKRAHMKTGGNFPYLSRADETNLHIQIHLRQFEGTKFTAKEEDLLDVSQEQT